MKDQGAGGDRLENGMIVSRNEYGRTLVIDVAEQAQQFGGKVGVEVTGGFVGEDQAWLVGEGAGNRNALLLTTRKRLGERRLPVLQAEPSANLDRATVGRARRPTVASGWL